MTGILLTIVTACAAFGLGAVLLQNLLARRIRVLVETARGRPAADCDTR